MAREKKADGVILALQAVGCLPRRIGWHPQSLGLAEAAENIALPRNRLFLRPVGHRHNAINGGKAFRAVLINRVQCSGGNQAFERFFVEHARINPPCQIAEVLERLVTPRRDQTFNRLRANTLDRRQRIADRQLRVAVLMHLEGNAGLVDARRINAEAKPLRFAAELRELVGIRHIERHGGRQKLDGEIGFQISCLIGDQRVSRGMALVEAVIGKFREQIENRIRRLGIKAAFNSAGNKALPLLIHFRLDLFAHRAAQQIGLAERIARQDLGDLHHLFLINDDAVGLFQRNFKFRMKIFRHLMAVFAGIIDRNIGHWARTIKRHQRNNILEAVRPHFRERLAHTSTFKLEHAHRFATPEHVKGAGIINRDRIQINRNTARADQLNGLLQDRQGFKAQKVEFDEARRLDPFHVELGHEHIGFGIAVERHQLF